MDELKGELIASVMVDRLERRPAAIAVAQVEQQAGDQYVIYLAMPAGYPAPRTITITASDNTGEGFWPGTLLTVLRARKETRTGEGRAMQDEPRYEGRPPAIQYPRVSPRRESTDEEMDEAIRIAYGIPVGYRCDGCGHPIRRDEILEGQTYVIPGDATGAAYHEACTPREARTGSEGATT